MSATSVPCCPVWKFLSSRRTFSSSRFDVGEVTVCISSCGASLGVSRTKGSSSTLLASHFVGNVSRLSCPQREAEPRLNRESLSPLLFSTLPGLVHSLFSTSSRFLAAHSRTTVSRHVVASRVHQLSCQTATRFIPRTRSVRKARGRIFDIS